MKIIAENPKEDALLGLAYTLLKCLDVPTDTLCSQSAAVVAILAAEDVAGDMPRAIRQEFLQYAARSIQGGMIEGGMERAADAAFSFAREKSKDKQGFCEAVLNGRADQGESSQENPTEDHAVPCEMTRDEIEAYYDDKCDERAGWLLAAQLTAAWRHMAQQEVELTVAESEDGYNRDFTFVVKRSYLEEQLEGEQTVEEFLSEYNSSDSLEIYTLALLDDAIIHSTN